ncbi:MAG TPA: aldo/keto reductase [Actinomycetota bacterium]|nr:aldo/keto reductase [Actinomycetota bacterium]
MAGRGLGRAWGWRLMLGRKLGAHGPDISVIGYGAWEAGGEMWGGEVEDDRTRQAMETAIERGVDWIDTAEAYGDGRSEELVGEVIRRHRGEVRVFTKVAPFKSGLRPEQVKSAAEGSLKRLGVDHIDLFQIHWPDTDGVPIEDTWGAMARLQDEGLVGYLGVSNFHRELVERCLAIRHVDSVQNQYSLLHREDEADLLPWLEQRGVGYLAYGPLAYGLLTGTITKETRFDPGDWRSGRWNLGYYDELFAPGKLEPNLEIVTTLTKVAERVDLPLPTLALRAALAVPGVTAAIAGSRNPRHARMNAEAGDSELDPEVVAEIRRILAA